MRSSWLQHTGGSLEIALLGSVADRAVSHRKTRDQKSWGFSFLQWLLYLLRQVWEQWALAAEFSGAEHPLSYKPLFQSWLGVCSITHTPCAASSELHAWNGFFFFQMRKFDLGIFSRWGDTLLLFCGNELVSNQPTNQMFSHPFSQQETKEVIEQKSIQDKSKLNSVSLIHHLSLV